MYVSLCMCLRYVNFKYVYVLTLNLPFAYVFCLVCLKPYC